MYMKEQPGAAIDSQLRELGASLVERTDRLASDISHNNEQIEKLQSRVAWVAIISGLVALVIVMRLLW
jgi:hypothetical protein